jgi:hypothetical protein
MYSAQLLCHSTLEEAILAIPADETPPIINLTRDGKDLILSVRCRTGFMPDVLTNLVRRTILPIAAATDPSGLELSQQMRSEKNQ